MKINREARLTARQLFRAVTASGSLNENALRQVVDELIALKPRHYYPILRQLMKLTELYQQEHTHSVDSAVELNDKGASVFTTLQQKFGAPADTTYRVDPALLGGLRVRVGSNVWDGSVRGRLDNLGNNLTQN
jgi:F-type H+-transporting ATPase subunit delta